MNKNKQAYDRPTTDVLVVRFEEGILFVSGGANYSSTRGAAGGDDVYGENDGELF